MCSSIGAFYKKARTSKRIGLTNKPIAKRYDEKILKFNESSHTEDIAKLFEESVLRDSIRELVLGVISLNPDLGIKELVEIANNQLIDCSKI